MSRRDTADILAGLQRQEWPWPDPTLTAVAERLIDTVAEQAGTIARIRAACEPLMTTTAAVTERWGEDVVEVPAALWHQWQRDMEALLSKEGGE